MAGRKNTEELIEGIRRVVVAVYYPKIWPDNNRDLSVAVHVPNMSWWLMEHSYARAWAFAEDGAALLGPIK